MRMSQSGFDQESRQPQEHESKGSAPPARPTVDEQGGAEPLTQGRTLRIRPWARPLSLTKGLRIAS